MKARRVTFLVAAAALILNGVLDPAVTQARTSDKVRSQQSRFDDGAVCSRRDQGSGTTSFPFPFMLSARLADSTVPSVRSAVGAVQRLLHRIGYTDASGAFLRVDGTFGKQTKHAVKAFQRDYRLEVDGKVGPQTWTALAREACDPWTGEQFPADDAILAALLTKTEAERALGVSRLALGSTRGACSSNDTLSSRYCGRWWDSRASAEVQVAVEYLDTAVWAKAALHEWKTRNEIHPHFWDEVIASTPTLFIGADRRKVGSVRVEAFQLDRRMLVRADCDRPDGDIAAATTCVRRLIAAQTPKAARFMDSLL